ncbi:MAG: substrate-binding domain-containing protein [Verrucomicrobiae bacterium]|nr:substrate-binding domain-containing protein [Verrucomicrobiae bacterium]MDW8345182.1 substrate-binding domain-containing protein [Verrucomicrobiae bacterium]
MQRFAWWLGVVTMAGSVWAQEPTTIAVIPKGTTHEFWKAIHAGARKAAEETGVNIIWKGPLREDNREEQIKVVEDMIVRKVNGIVLAPLDDTALRAPVHDAVRRGIPVVIIDSDLKSDRYVSFVATDNREGGRRGAQRLAEVLGGKGRVVMLRYAEGSASTMNREEGFLEEIRKHPGIEVVSANQYGGATTETAYRASENLLAPYKKDGQLTIDGIFCVNESTTFGMLRALQDGGLAGKVRFVGFDVSPKLLEALQAGQMDGLVVQNPYRMGYLGVKTMVAHLRGEPVEKRIDTGVALVTRENLDTPEIQAVLRPALEALR